MTHWQSTELGVWQCKGKGKGTKDTWSPGKFADKGASKGEAGKGKEHQRNGEGAHLNDRRAPSHNANQPVDEPGLDTTEQEVNNMEHYVNPQETPGNAIDDLQNPTPVDSTAVRRPRLKVRNLLLPKMNHVVATEEDDYGRVINWQDLIEEVTFFVFQLVAQTIYQIEVIGAVLHQRQTDLPPPKRSTAWSTMILRIQSTMGHLQFSIQDLLNLVLSMRNSTPP